MASTVKNIINSIRKKEDHHFTKLISSSDFDGQGVVKLWNVETNQDHTLDLPPNYQGSKLFMPNGERLYWQAEVIPPPYGPTTCQDFEEIRSRCLSEGKLFEDPEFPANDTSLLLKDNPLGSHNVKWLRPREISENPQLCVKTYSRFDVNQGELGDCWLNSAMATLTMRKNFFYQVVPNGQRFDKDYAGVFHFRFWQYGRWVDVVIDDRLPTCYDELVFASSSEEDEFWSPLLEKAYAKLYGSYQAIVAGQECEALEDFTGGLPEIYPTEVLQKYGYDHLIKSYERNSLLGAAIFEKTEDLCGLKTHHVYSITSVKYLDSKTPLIRLRNPWGSSEWTGAWSDKSSEWEHVSEDKKKDLGFKIAEDGEFWMSYNDFTKYFETVSICNLNPSSVILAGSDSDFEYSDKKWEMYMFEGKWVLGETSGGSSLYGESHWLNPQYILTVTEPDEDKKECTVILSLTQKYGRTRHGVNFLPIGFSISRCDDAELQGHLDEEFFSEHKPLGDLPYLEVRAWTIRMTLEPGRYVIVPSPEKPDLEGEYLMRVLSIKPLNITKLADNEKHINEIDDNDISVVMV